MQAIEKKAAGSARQKEIWQDRLFNAVVMVLVILLLGATLYPLYLVVICSVSDAALVTSGQVTLYPKGLTLLGYKSVFQNQEIWRSYLNSIVYTLSGTVISLVVTMGAAFALSRNFPFKRLISFLFAFTMFFNGGMIPTYLAVSKIGLLDSHWSLILPGLVSAYNVILMRNYIQGLPEELEDSASIDGASQFQLMWKIILPLTLPSLATIGLFCCVGYWNTYFNAVIYINSRDKAMLQIYLREVLISTQSANLDAGMDELANMASSESVQGACVVATALPIILVYPWLQKYYVKGMTLGAVKG